MSANVSIVSVVVNDNDHNSAYSEGDTLTLTFSQPIFVQSNFNAQVVNPVPNQAPFVYLSGNGDFSSQVTGTFQSPLIIGDVLINAYAPGEVYSIARQFIYTEDYQMQYSDLTFVLPGFTDSLAPTVTTFSPADGISGFAPNGNITLTYSETIQRGAGTIAIHSGSATGTIVETYNAASSSNISISDNTLTINPTADLLNSTHYYVTFDSGSVKDLAGNNYTGTTSYDFTTSAETIPPTITSFFPIDDAIRVPVGSNISITFSEPIQLGTEHIVLKTSTGTVVESYTLGSSDLTINGNVLTINPTHDLDNKTSYILDIEYGAVKDLAGNSFAGSTSYNFTTVGLTTSEAILERAYIAYFGRPAEPEGFNWWLSTVSSQGGIDAVMNNVYRDFCKSSEYLRAYASDLDPVTHAVINAPHLLNSIYENLFHRDIEQGGLDYWGTLVSQGAVTINSVVLEVLNGARNSDFDAVNSKIDAAIALTHRVDVLNASGYAGDNAALVAHDWLGGIYDASTLNSALVYTSLTSAAEHIIAAGTNVSLVGVVA
jgi:methionine-rich copper-binding protein CopC